MSLEQFDLQGVLGEGAYGCVYLALNEDDQKYYAVKAISKRKLLNENKSHQVFRERKALLTLDHPNIIKLKWCFDVMISFKSY